MAIMHFMRIKCVLIFEVKAVLSVCLVEIGMKVLCCNRFQVVGTSCGYTIM